MSNNLRATTRANGCKFSNRTFKAIERIATIIHDDLECIMIGVSTLITSLHWALLEGRNGFKQIMGHQLPTLPVGIVASFSIR